MAPRKVVGLVALALLSLASCSDTHITTPEVPPECLWANAQHDGQWYWGIMCPGPSPPTEDTEEVTLTTKWPL